MKTTIISIFVVVILIGGTMFLTRGNSNLNNDINNVNIVDGKQIITINAKGGYTPRMTIAKADMPTIIKVNTRGTFDCSSALVIPSLNYRTNLPNSGETLIDVPAQKAGTKLQGLCAMGMYNFSIDFN
jgi:plastocyanin domain-containing protein